MEQKPTELEIEIVQRLADGQNVPELAAISEIGAKAMESRVVRIRLKYGFKTIAGLCVYFCKKGWIT